MANKELTSPRVYHFLPWFHGLYDSLSFIVLVLRGLDHFIWAGFFSSGAAANICKSSDLQGRTTAGTLTFWGVRLFILSLQQHLKSLCVWVCWRALLREWRNHLVQLFPFSLDLRHKDSNCKSGRGGGGALCSNPLFLGLCDVVRC